jgi:uncharacterized protein YyaL (SSP411 family)
VSDATHTNRLVHATSPYLLPHAHNPVDWYEWGPEALKRARDEDRPILLSIGYAACHWCHVMAHESFEDPTTAAFMNEHFVPIKVDREERPDIDAVYMDAVQAMTGHGGWPLTAFLTPKGEPFYGGTYFPPEDRHGLPGFPKVLAAIDEAWRERRERMTEDGTKLTQALSRGLAMTESHDPLTEAILTEGLRSIARTFDPEWGGFGPAPKFPQPSTLEFLLHMHHRGQPDALHMVTTTLDKMADGGIHDQVGGGFHRYSTDERWLVPHFEKMLYDNAQLARVYLHAWQVTGESRYRTVVDDVLSYLRRHLRHAEGGFFSSQDADSEGEEGTFYVWSWSELIEAATNPGLAFPAITSPERILEVTEHLAAFPPELVLRSFGATPEGNWDGTNVLWSPRPLDEFAHEAGVPEDDLRVVVGGTFTALQMRRQRRVPPSTDDKVLASWNGLAIQAYAEAGRAMGFSLFVEMARQAADFVLTNLRRDDGRLLRSWRDGRTSGPGFLDDYAAVGLGCLALYESTFELRWMREARSLADEMIRLFHDPDGGGFFQTGSDAEALVVRPKELFDNAVPSGNSMAAELLLRLSQVTGDQAYERAGVSGLRVAANLMTRAPAAFGHALGALDRHLGPSYEIAIIGDPSDASTVSLAGEVWRRYLPTTVLAVAGPDDEAARSLIPLLADRPLRNGRPAAYVCQHFACRMPVTEPAELAAQL